MKRFLPIWILFCLNPFLASSQLSVSIDPENFEMSGKPTETNIFFDVDVTNTSGQTIYLLWSKRLNNAPADWWSWICDENACYLPTEISCPENHPDTLLSGETIAIQMHLHPRNIEGTGEYTVNLTDQNGDPLGTITGIVTISLSSATSQVQKQNNFTVFPNPATDYFQTSSLPRLRFVEIYNILGHKIKSLEAAPNKHYPVEDLAEGIYLVRLIGSSKEILKTIRLNVQ